MSSSVEMKAGPAKEGGHWYTKDGFLVEEIKGANGKMRRPNVRDARKHGFVPGVTTIIRAAAAPHLQRWKEEQLVKAMLRVGVPRLFAESEGAISCEPFGEYMTRLREQVAEMTKLPLEVGTKVHGDLHRYVTDRGFWEEENQRGSVKLNGTYVTGIWAEIERHFLDWDEMLDRFALDAYRPDPDTNSYKTRLYNNRLEWHMGECQPWAKIDHDAIMDNECMTWRSEDPVVHPLGFATKADLWTPDGGGWLFDFKGKETADKMSTEMRDEHLMQLAATREAIKKTHKVIIPQQHCRIIYFARDARDEGHAQMAHQNHEGIQRGWRMFKAIHAYWAANNKINQQNDKD